VALGRNRAPFYGSLIAVGSNVVLSYLLIHWIGLTGPAVATVVTAHLLLLYYLTLLQRTLRIPWGETFPLRPVLLTLAVAAIPGVLILPVAQADGMGRLGRLMVAGLLFTVATYTLYRVTGLLRSEEVRLFRGYMLDWWRGLVRSRVKTGAP
jgi:O-antigen/teichoic acid export membrane protein